MRCNERIFLLYYTFDSSERWIVFILQIERNKKMGKTEAFCTQCGSLINIDDNKDKNKCLFCGTEIVTTKALDLKSDPQTRAMLQKEAEQKAIEAAKAKKEQQKLNKGSKPDAVAVPAAKQVVVITPIPFKTKMTILGIFVGFVLLLSAIFIPTILNRNAKRDVLSAQLKQKISFNIKNPSDNAEYNISFNYNDNHELLLASDADLTETAAKEAYQTYLTIYKEAYSISTEKAQNRITVKVYAKNGLYQCKNVKGIVTVQFDTATPTPTPTLVPASSSAGSSAGSSSSK